MIFQYEKDMYSTCKKDLMIDADFSDHVGLLTNPTIGDKSTRNGFTPASFDYKNKDEVPRDKEHVSMYYALVVDFDDGDVCPALWASHHKQYEHLVCTSYSHKRHEPKFHAVIPLDKPITADELYRSRFWLRDHFKGCDKSSFTRSRLFYTAGHDGSTQSELDFYSNYNQANERFSIPDHVMNPVVKPPTKMELARAKLREQERESKFFANDLYSAIERIRTRHALSLHHDDLRSICSALKTEGVPRNEIESLLRDVKLPSSKEAISKTFDNCEANHNSIGTLFYLSNNDK